RYTCDGEDVSPPLHWTGIPEGTLDIAVLVDDPDAPGGSFTHWVMWGLDPGMNDLAEGVVPSGARQAKNSFGAVGYGGPCPPVGESHTYAITLFALGSRIPLQDGAPAKDVRAQIARRSIDQDLMTAAYTR
ncbi:MAG TPA: YbhB/YbcL family Raf kinase inhibitor-like protein, partial [Actinomycetota bacterium]|nr:YbhB/YbcL family Raf kinase inhibitor-like protein [Actinomycetota bacterium]